MICDLLFGRVIDSITRARTFELVGGYLGELLHELPPHRRLRGVRPGVRLRTAVGPFARPPPLGCPRTLAQLGWIRIRGLSQRHPPSLPRAPSPTPPVAMAIRALFLFYDFVSPLFLRFRWRFKVFFVRKIIFYQTRIVNITSR